MNCFICGKKGGKTIRMDKELKDEIYTACRYILFCESCRDDLLHMFTLLHEFKIALKELKRKQGERKKPKNSFTACIK